MATDFDYLKELGIPQEEITRRAEAEQQQTAATENLTSLQSQLEGLTRKKSTAGLSQQALEERVRRDLKRQGKSEAEINAYFSPIDDPLKNRERKIQLSNLFNVARRDLGKETFVSEKARLGREIEQARGAESSLLANELERQRGFLQSSQEQLLGKMQEQNVQFQEALNAQLQDLLSQAGVQFGEARQQVGANLAAQGLGRSTQAVRDIGQVNLAQQQQQQQLRAESESAKFASEQRTKQARQAIAEQKAQTRQAQSIAELNSLEQMSFALQTQDLEDRFKQDLAQIQLDIQSKSFLGSALGGILGGAAKIFTGKLF